MRLLARGAALLIPALLLALIAYGLVTRAPNTTIDSHLDSGRSIALPQFSLKVLTSGSVPGPLGRRFAGVANGQSISSARLRGIPFALNLWASWCSPCRDETPLLQRIWAAQRSPRVLILGLDQQDLRSDAHDFLRGFSVSYPTIRDPSDDVARSLGATGVPETFFVDARGQVVDHVIGAIDAQQLQRGEAAALTGQTIAAAQGGAQESLR
jgi:cytochrome c biogenesis protein CcmG/thiol:disulfide interchange protein DsbE